MKTTIAHGADLNECVSQLRRMAGLTPRLVVYFASPAHDPALAAAAFRNSFSDALVLGCSTAGEISSRAMTEGQVVAMAIPAALIPCAGCAYIDDPADSTHIVNALERLSAQLGRPVAELDPATHVGLVLVDGLSVSEERLMEKLGDLCDIPFVGGSAGDDLAFARTWISLDGIAHDHGAVIAIIHLPAGYEIVKAQSFQSTGKTLIPTAVDEARRCVMEFGGEPAALAYAGALGIAVDQLPDHFGRHPLGLMISGEPFVRSPQKVLEDGSIVFYCSVRQGMNLQILESTDMIEDTRKVLSAKLSKFAEVAGLLNFNCILRTLELKAGGLCAGYSGLFRDVPTVGFSTYGEEYLGHINQTATMLVIAG